MDKNAGLGLKIQIVDLQSYQFGDTQSSSEAEMKHCAISDAVFICWVRRI
jgi:hypothetical protein